MTVGRQADPMAMLAEADLERGIEAQEFVLHYQPRISLEDRKLIGFEALVRWKHPERGLLAPRQFLRLAEDSGLMVPLSRWVLNEACRQLAAWHDDSPGQRPLSVSVNTSFQYLADCSVLRDVQRILSETELYPGSLRFEMAENSIIDYGEVTSATLHRLRAMRIGLEIDDFGTGTASLNYLRELPFDTLKIDRSFVRELGTSKDSSDIISKILKFVGSLGIGVAAEGVETRDQFNRLNEMGCRRGQGYYFSPPVDASTATGLIRNELERRPEVSPSCIS